MKILFIASECAPLAKVGGLADVIAALPKALKKERTDVSIVIPFYTKIEATDDFQKCADLTTEFNGQQETFELWETQNFGVPLFLIKKDKFFGGDIYLEKDASSGGSEKEISRFLFLSVAGLKVAEYLDAQILHCHDWQTAIIPYLNKIRRGVFKTMLTIHNLGYQGIYGHEIVNRLIDTDFAETVNCLATGILNSDLITTVSPSYAQEILTEKDGASLEKILAQRKNDLVGILNGIDVEEFNPESDPFLPKNYSPKNLIGKTENKKRLQEYCFKNTKPQTPVLSIISRLAAQKGLDLLKEIFDELMRENLQIILLGQGAKEYEDFFAFCAKKFPDKFFTKFLFDEKLAHQIYAASDIFLMPSQYEPCGLGQQIAMRYGALIVASAVGGIKDTVQNHESGDIGTGFLFKNYSAAEFLKSIKKALAAFSDKQTWSKLQQNAMAKDFSWDNSAKKYLEQYRLLLKA
ncbi:MAG: hypothetical protein A2174_02545 [Candidatus Portnoybacteria bacterium RBG_13_41_18]|uniref:Glycogen synthase n=1 Tax=Candidatus Portnoybacteria bacterium RBG_13_41_18 TaxID=1801991 RepID=A0A1G2F9B4_9BACT|nr:MAG: hypothetical protein A2174_02545 [Candidatus Portnoybacteria bacterium RBG_13_41_18]